MKIIGITSYITLVFPEVQSLLIYKNIQMEQVNKKERTKNFTESEKIVLIELVQERCKILENKTTNSVSVNEKEDCWEDLRMKFMSRSNGVVRTVQSLKTCWENIKKRTKKQYAEEKQAIYKTGGGQYKAISDPIAEQVREIIRPAVEGLSNAFDNDCITGFENNFDRNEEFGEEWLEEGVTESVTERDEGDTEGDEDSRERDEDDREGNKGARKDDDKFYTEEGVVLNFLQKDKLSWKNWNPQKLQTQISTPLRTSVNKRKSAASVNHSASTSQNKRSKENDFVPSALKETAKKTSNQLKEKNNNNNSNNRLVKFGTLADNKIELVNLMMDNGKEKHELEIEILKIQLQKEKFQVEIMQKEFELKTLILEREKRGLKNYVSYMHISFFLNQR